MWYQYSPQSIVFWAYYWAELLMTMIHYWNWNSFMRFQYTISIPEWIRVSSFLIVRLLIVHVSISFGLLCALYVYSLYYWHECNTIGFSCSGCSSVCLTSSFLLYPKLHYHSNVGSAPPMLVITVTWVDVHHGDSFSCYLGFLVFDHSHMLFMCWLPLSEWSVGCSTWRS